MLSVLLKVSNYSWVKNPAFSHAAYNAGTACPLDKTNLSFPKYLGFFTSWFNPIYEKNKIDKKSAIDAELVGCPLFAF